MRYSVNMRNNVKKITILGVSIHDVLMDEAVDQIASFVRGGGPHQVVTVNPEFIMAAQHNPTFRSTLQRADLAVPDGVGLNLVARWLGQPLRGRVPGVELCERLAALSTTTGYRLFLLGAAPGVAEAAATALRQRFPGTQIVGCYSGSPQLEDE